MPRRPAEPAVTAATPRADGGSRRDALQPPEHDWTYEIPRPVVAVGFETTLTTMQETRVHHHRKAQLILALGGTVICEAGDRAWIVPPQCAVWTPGGQPHGFRAAGALKVCCLFFDPAVVPAMPRESCTLKVSALLRELLLQTVSLPMLYDLDGPPGRLIAVLLDQLTAAPVENRPLPMPRDPRLRRIAGALLADPAARLTMAEWGRHVGASERTLARLLRGDTGMSFGRWRQQMLVFLALRHLAEGSPVQVVASTLGYESASAFIAMFRKVLGKSPVRYLADHSRTC